MNRYQAGLAFILSLFGAAPIRAQPLWPPRSFSAYYAAVEDDTPEKLANFDLLIVHPGKDGENLDVARIAKLRQTGKAKTIVGYISIGEDDTSPGGPPIAGRDESGPSFVGADLKVGLAHNGYPSYFVDARKLVFGSDGFLKFGPNGKPLEEKGQDGHPDENGVWGSFYVKAGDPIWEAKVFAGLDRLDKLGLDGFFLDTVDTASPWGDYGWTSSEMLELVAKIRARYPKKKIVANRGLFYMGQNDRYAKLVDAVLFESLLTNYSSETKSSSISPWSRWHVQALDDDVIPSQKRTGVGLLVLDYLNPEEKNATLLVQSARTLLAGTPHALSFSNPSLQIPGWDADELLTAGVPSSWPSVTAVVVVEESLGQFTLKVDFDGPVPDTAIPDLRVTTRDDLQPDRAAQLPLSEVTSWKVGGDSLTLSANGLDKAKAYRVFFRLISRSPSPQSPFAWSSFMTAASDLPGQAADLSSESDALGLKLNFTAPDAKVTSYRVYSLDEKGGKKLLAEETGNISPIRIPGAQQDEALRLIVVGVDAQGREGYPSATHEAVMRDVTPPQKPGAVVVSTRDKQAMFRWDAVDGAESYRLYTIPRGQTFRLPLVTSEPEVQLEGIKAGEYRVFVTAVDDNGNQSGPGPSVTWTAP